MSMTIAGAAAKALKSGCMDHYLQQAVRHLGQRRQLYEIKNGDHGDLNNLNLKI